MLPELTAEAALDERSAHYRMGGGPALGSLVDSSALMPQQVGAAAIWLHHLRALDRRTP